MASNNTFVLEFKSSGSKLVIKQIEQSTGAIEKNTKAKERNQKQGRKRSIAADKVLKQQKGIEQGTLNSTKAFSKLSQQLGGIVPIYAQVAANVFAITAAFGALERAADFGILTDAAAELEIQTGRSLTGIATSMKAITGEAISMKEALTQASIAASAGFDNTTIERLTQVSRNASVALGREMTDALNRVFKGAIKAEPELLDELGIILRLETAANKYAQSLNKSAKDLTTFEKQQAVVNEVLEQGEEKFGRLSKVDPNPYTLLSSAFSDITTNMLNFISTPIGSFIGFLSKNTESLTAIIILLSSSILKMSAGPINDLFVGFSKSIDNTLKAVTSLADQLGTAFTSRGIGIVENIDKVKVSMSSLTNTVSKLGNVTKSGPGVKALRNAFSPGSTLTDIEKVNKGLLSVRNSLKLLRVDTAGNAQSINTLKILEKNLTKTQSALIKSGKSASTAAVNFTTFGNALNRVSLSANIAAASIKTVGLAASIAATDMLVAEGVSQSWGSFRENLVVVAKRTKGLTKIFSLASSALGSVGAAVFKMIPFLSQLIIGWQILSGVFTFFKDAIGLGDISRLTESLESQEEQLNTSAEAVENYENNLIKLPSTLANTNEQLTLQSNVLAEMAGSINKVNTAIKSNGGFGFLSGIADFFGSGDQQNVKNNTVEALKQLDSLGLGKSLDPEIRKLAESFTLGESNIIKMSDAFEKFIKEAQRASNAAKEANSSIIKSVEDANKASSTLFGSLPSLGPVEGALVVITKLSQELESNNIEKVADALGGLSDAARKDFGINVTSKDLLSFNKAMKTSSDRLKEISPILSNLQGIAEGSRNPKIKSDILALVEEQELLLQLQKDAKDSITTRIGDPFGEVIAQMTAIVTNAKKLKTALNAIDLSKLNTQNTTLDNLNQLKEEVKLKNDSLSIDRDRSSKSKTDSLIIEKGLVKEIAIARNSLLSLDKTDERNNVRKLSLEGKISNLITQRSTNAEKLLKLDKDLASTDGKKFTNELKFNKAILKERNKIAQLDAKGGFGEGEKLDKLNKDLGISNRELAKLNSNSETFANSITDAQIEATRLSSALQQAGVSSNSSIINATDSINNQTTSLTQQLELSSKLNDTLFLRADAQALIQVNAKKAEVDSAVSERLALQSAIDNGTKNKEIGQKSINQLIIREANLRSNIVAIQDKSTAALAKKVEVTAQNLKSSNNFLRQEIKFGTLVTKQDAARLKIAQLRDKLKGNGSKDIERIIKLTKEQIKLQRKLDFSKEIRKSAQAMNDLADGMNRVNDSIDGGDSIEQFVSGLILIQDIGQSIGGDLGKASEGLATFSASLIDTSINLDSITEKQSSLEEVWGDTWDTAASDAKLANLEASKTQIILSGTANALGALAGTFKEGSDQAKVFTLLQQGVAIASAASAVAIAATLAPPAGFAAAAAMLGLLTSVLGAAGIAFSGSSKGDGGAAKGRKEYEASVGEQGLVGRDLRTNTLIEGLDAILSIDTLFYSEAQKMENHLANLNDNFSILAASIFTALGKNLGGLEFKGISEEDPRVTVNSGTNIVGDLINDVTKGISILTLGITDALGLGKVGKEIGRFFGGKTTITEELLDKGLEFQAVINDLSEGLSGSLDTDIFNVIQINTKRKRSFGRSTKFSSVIDTFTAELEPTLNGALNDAFNNVLTGIELTVKQFTKAIPNLNPDIFLSKLTGFKIEESLSLEGLDEEEAQEAIAAFFSAATDDIVSELFPFVEKFRQAGEDLSGTFFRLTADAITVDEAFSLVGESLQSISAPELVFERINNVGIDGNTLLNTKGIGKSIEKDLKDLQFVDESTIKSSVSKAAADFQAEFSAIWVEELLKGFGGDAKAFAKEFDLLIGSIFNEDELKKFKDDKAFAAINQGFTDLLQITEKLGLTNLSDILLGSTLSSDTVRKFFDEATRSNAFAAVSQAGDVLGATMQGIITGLGSALDQVKREIVEVEEVVRNLDFVREIALFGLPDKEQQLLQTAFDYQVAITAAREAGDDLGAVEIAFGLRRINIVKEAFEEIESTIKDSMNSVLSSTIEVASASKRWDNLAFSIVKINKLVTRLRKGLNGTDLSSLLDTTDRIQEFSDNFRDIIDAIETASPTDIKNEIELVNTLRDEIVSKYELEKQLIEDIEESYQDFALDIQGFLNDLFLSDLSPLTNFEQLNEAEKQFEANLNAIRFGSEEEKAKAIDNILASSTNFLEQASEFFAIGPAYQAIFDRVTNSLDSLGLDFDESTKDTSIEDKLEELNAETLEQLSVLDNILDALDRNNQDTLAQDVGNAVTEGLLSEIAGITHKLDQLGTGIWATISTILKETKSAAAIQTESVITNLARYDIDKLTGFITTAIGEGFGGINFPAPVVNVNVNVDVPPPTFIRGTPTETDPTTEKKAPPITPIRVDPIGITPGRNPRPNPFPGFTDEGPYAFNDSGSAAVTAAIIARAKQGIPEAIAAAEARGLSFAVGTPDIPGDMLANVHRGEMIIPETFAQGIRSGSVSVSGGDFIKDLPETLINELRSGSINLGNTSDNEDVIQAIKELTEVLAISQEDLVDIANKNSEISEEIAASLQGNRRTTNTAGVA